MKCKWKFQKFHRPSGDPGRNLPLNKGPDFIQALEKANLNT